MDNEDCKTHKPAGQLLAKSFPAAAWKVSNISGIGNEFDSTPVQYLVNIFFSAQCETQICGHWP